MMNVSSTTSQLNETSLLLTTPPIPTSNIPEVDIFLGTICFLCMAVGVPGNIITLRHFLRQKKDLPTILYLLISSNDLTITSTLFPTALSLLSSRRPGVFGLHVFCQWWGLLWTILPFISVFLVAVLSITRSLVLMRPLVEIKKRVVFIILGVYYSYIILRVMIPFSCGQSHFIYSRPDLYCWDGVGEPGSWYFYYDIATGLLQLAAPIIPIFVSCLLSNWTLLGQRSFVGTVHRGSAGGSNKISHKVNATITILLVTTVYIVFNIPTFVAWILYLYDGLTVHKTSTFMYWYLWCIVYVIFVGANGAANPVILYWRNRKFRDSVGRSPAFSGRSWQFAKLRRRSARTSGTFGVPRTVEVMCAVGVPTCQV